MKNKTAVGYEVYINSSDNYYGYGFSRTLKLAVFPTKEECNAFIKKAKYHFVGLINKFTCKPVYSNKKMKQTKEYNSRDWNKVLFIADLAQERDGREVVQSVYPYEEIDYSNNVCSKRRMPYKIFDERGRFSFFLEIKQSDLDKPYNKHWSKRFRNRALNRANSIQSKYWNSMNPTYNCSVKKK